MVLPEMPIWPAPLPRLRTESRSSASTPPTVRCPPESEVALVKVTSGSSSFGAALTSFSAKVTLAASFASVTVMATALAALLSVPSEAMTVMS